MVWGVLHPDLATPLPSIETLAENDRPQQHLAENNPISESGGVKSLTHAAYFVSLSYSKDFHVRSKFRTSACTVGENNIYIG